MLAPQELSTANICIVLYWDLTCAAMASHHTLFISGRMIRCPWTLLQRLQTLELTCSTFRGRADSTWNVSTYDGKFKPALVFLLSPHQPAMAGNIVPAIATTNAVIAGLIVMEALKVLAGDFNKCKQVKQPSLFLHYFLWKHVEYPLFQVY